METVLAVGLAVVVACLVVVVALRQVRPDLYDALRDRIDEAIDLFRRR